MIEGRFPIAWLYVIGAFSCWYHGTTFWLGLFWPFYIGRLFT